MKIGFNLLLWTADVKPEHYGLLTKLKKAGYDGVELPIFNLDVAGYKELGNVLKNEGLRSTCVTVMPGEQASCVSPDAASRRGAVDHLKKVVDCAQAAGCEILMGPIHQPLGIFTGVGPTETENNHAADVHRQAATYAAQANVRLVIEWLNRFECYFLTTMAQASNYVKLVNHSNFSTMWDTFHANIEEKKPALSLANHLDVITHCHISENDRGTPGKGHAEIYETIQILKAAKYDGWLTIEAFGRALPELAAATRVWRDFYPSTDEVYLEGIRYIRECLAK
jgi:D-psicose/D-tagatose/L-ribulose 3-epimerase